MDMLRFANNSIQQCYITFVFTFAVILSWRNTHTYIYTQWEKKCFDPLLILYVCPLTRWSVYNFFVAILSLFK